MSSVLELEIELEVSPRVWRRVRIPKEATLDQLHEVIQLSFGWKNCHLHSFLLKDGRQAGPAPDPMFASFLGGPEQLDEAEITLAEVLPRKRSRLVYVYDWGDHWSHHVTLVDRLDPNAIEGALPSCVAGGRACPPEDCGGPPGYMDLLEILRAGPKDEWDEERLDWLGEDFDPEAFDLEEAEALLKRYCQPRPAKKKSTKKKSTKKKAAKKKATKKKATKKKATKKKATKKKATKKKATKKKAAKKKATWKKSTKKKATKKKAPKRGWLPPQ